MEVKEVIDNHQPQLIFVAGRATTFAFGVPVTMTAKDIHQLAAHSPTSTIWITQLKGSVHKHVDAIFRKLPKVCYE